MAIIVPSLHFEGSHLGERNDPDPGDYTALLVDVQFTNEKKSHIRIEWELTNHTETAYTWIVRHTCPLAQKHIGFLNQHLWNWKRKKWHQLGETLDERLETMLTWIGDEANVRVDSWDPERPWLVSVIQVWSIGMSWPPSWACDEDDAD